MASDFEIPDDIRPIVEGICRFVEAEILPLESDIANPRTLYDESGRYSEHVIELKRRVRRRSADAGYFQMFAPEEIGGGGLGPVAALWIYYELGRRYGGRLYPGPFRMELISNFVNGPNQMHLWMTDEYKRTVLPRVLDGELATCFALTEPDAGSDVWMLRTRAEKRGDHWILNGRKQWITNGPYADYAMVFAVTDDELFKARKGGVSAFFVDTTSAGYEVESVTKIFGHLGGNEGLIAIEDVRVPEAAIVGELHGGFRLMMLGVSLGRMMNAGQSVGLAEWAFKMALEYSQDRVTFGKRLCDHQAIQWKLAESAMGIYASKALALRVAAAAEKARAQHGPMAVPVKEVAMAKAYCIESANRVVDHAIQIHGGMGFSNELKLTRVMEAVRLLRVPDGSSEMQRRTIANRLLKGDVAL